MKILPRESNAWRRKIREAVELRTHKPEMKRDNGYDLPAMYIIVQRHSQGRGRARPGGLTSSSLKKANDDR